MKNNICKNKYPDGMLPPENQLVNEFKCSRNTIRRSIARLNDEGYVQSLKGKGVVILEPLELKRECFQLDFKSFAWVSSLVMNNKANLTTSVLSFEKSIIDENSKKITGFQVGVEVYHLVRIRYLDNEPLLLDINYFRSDIVSDLTVSIAQNSIYDYIKNVLNKKILAARRTIAIKKATKQDKALINLKDHDCVGILYNNAYVEDGRIFEYTESHFVPDRFVFSQFVQN
nr:GntR family transcriptional regulator [Clostridium sp. ZBS15]